MAYFSTLEARVPEPTPLGLNFKFLIFSLFSCFVLNIWVQINSYLDIVVRHNAIFIIWIWILILFYAFVLINYTLIYEYIFMCKLTYCFNWFSKGLTWGLTHLLWLNLKELTEVKKVNLAWSGIYDPPSWVKYITNDCVHYF